jgi:hypothetical protein
MSEVDKFIKANESTSGAITEWRYLVLELAKAIQKDME